MSIRSLKVYNIVLLFKPSTDHSIIKSVISKIFEISGSENDALYLEYWGLRKTAYPINKDRKKHTYAHYYYTLTPVLDTKNKVAIDEFLKYNKSLLRYMFISLKKRSEITKDPSYMMINRKRDVEDGGVSIPFDFDFNMNNLFDTTSAINESLKQL